MKRTEDQRGMSAAAFMAGYSNPIARPRHATTRAAVLVTAERVPCEFCCQPDRDATGSGVVHPGWQYAEGAYDRAYADDFQRFDGVLYRECRQCRGSGLQFYCALCNDYIAGEVAHEVAGELVCKAHVGQAVAGAVKPC